MIIIDYLLIVIIAVSAVISLFRGFVKESLSLVGWVVAIWAASRFGLVAADWLDGTIDSYALRLWCGRAIILIVVLFASGLISWAVSQLLDSTGLSGTDRAIGMLFGLARGVILAGIVVLLLELAGFDKDAWWNDSKLIPYAAPVADLVKEVAEDGIEYFDVDGEQVIDAAQDKATKLLTE